MELELEICGVAVDVGIGLSCPRACGSGHLTDIDPEFGTRDKWPSSIIYCSYRFELNKGLKEDAMIYSLNKLLILSMKANLHPSPFVFIPSRLNNVLIRSIPYLTWTGWLQKVYYLAPAVCAPPS